MARAAGEQDFSSRLSASRKSWVMASFVGMIRALAQVTTRIVKER